MCSCFLGEQSDRGAWEKGMQVGQCIEQTSRPAQVPGEGKPDPPWRKPQAKIERDRSKGK